MKLKLIFFLLFIFILSSCTHADKPMILESEFTFDLKVIPKFEGGIFGINISGLCGHSAFAVKNLDVKKDTLNPNILAILIYLVPAKKPLSGSFDQWIQIPNETTQAVFGANKKIIWKR